MHDSGFGSSTDNINEFETDGEGEEEVEYEGVCDGKAVVELELLGTIDVGFGVIDGDKLPVIDGAAVTNMLGVVDG